MRTGMIVGIIAALSVLGACTKPAGPAPTPAAAPADAQGPALPPPNPGDGSVKCPGSEACPNVTLANPPIGIAGAEPGNLADGRPRMLICTVDPRTTDAGCPPGYEGRLILPDANLQTPTVCRHGAAPCKTNSWAIICSDGAKGCPMLPRIEPK